MNLVSFLSLASTPAVCPLVDNPHMHDSAVEETEHGGLGAFSLGSLLSHPSVLSKLQNIDIRFLLADLLRSESDRYNTNSPLDSTPASPQVRRSLYILLRVMSYILGVRTGVLSRIYLSNRGNSQRVS